MRQIHLASVLGLVCVAGSAAQITVFSPDGEILDTVFPPRGRRPFSELVGSYPDDSLLELVACAPQAAPVNRMMLMETDTLHDSGANPDWKPAGDLEMREMRALVDRMAKSEQRMRRMLPDLVKPPKQAEPVLETDLENAAARAASEPVAPAPEPAPAPVAGA